MVRIKQLATQQAGIHLWSKKTAAMCPQPPTEIFRGIASWPDVHRDLADAALSRLQLGDSQAKLQKAGAAMGTASVKNKSFTCTLYSLDNKAYWGDGEDHWSVEKGDPMVTNPSAVVEFPGNKVRDVSGILAKDSKNQPIPDFARDQAWDKFEKVYDFYRDVFKRNSIDNNGVEMRAIIHVGRGYDNAFWSPTKQVMFFGDAGRFDGRGWLLPTKQELDKDKEDKEHKRFTKLQNWFCNYDIDTICHELTHGVIGSTAKLGETQSSAAAFSEAMTLNEHIADCFAIMLKHRVNNHTAETGNWDFSPGCWSQAVMDAKEPKSRWTENYLRTFRIPANPATSPDDGPKHWSKRRPFGGGRTGLDPHVNCGIASHAFYLAARALGGHTWEKLGQVWYAALVDPAFALPENQTFLGWKKLTVEHADKLYGANVKKVLEKAWADVGL